MGLNKVAGAMWRVLGGPCLCFAASCGPGVQVPQSDLPPLATLSVEIEPTVPLSTRGEGDLYAALIWAQAWENPAICHLAPEHPVTRNVCRDPYSVVLGEVSAVVPITEGVRQVELNVLDLPPSDVAVGDGATRLSYGTVVVVSDVFQMLSHVGANGTALGPAFWHFSDITFYGASFVSLIQPHERIVVREGGFDRASHFYPYPLHSCGTPKRGFSLLRVGGTESGIDQGTCVFESPPSVIRVLPLSTAQADGWRCNWAARHRVWPPRYDLPGGPEGQEHYEPPPTRLDSGEGSHRIVACVTPDILAAAPIVQGIGPGCGEIFIWALAACSRNLLCAQPEWDVRDAPPAEWPCK